MTGKFQFKASTKPALGNNLLSIKWEVDENDYAEINASTGELEVKKVGTEDSNTQITIHITAHLNDGSTLKSEKKVKLFVRPIKLGDYLFSDFTYGSKLSDSDKHPIGICFYIDPRDRDYAIAVALKDLDSLTWGLDSDSIGNIKLKDNPSLSVYDIADLNNQYNNQLYINDSTILDSSNTVNDGFKEYSSDTVFGGIGFITITSTIYNKLKSYLDKADLKIGDKISYGQFKTLTIIAHRDMVLTDSGINKPVPQETATMSELECLKKYIQDIVLANNSSYSQYYFPQASYCFAYTLSVDKTEVGLHKWYLPSSGELVRFIWYSEQGTSFDNKNAIFSQGVQDAVFKPPVRGNDLISSSSEVLNNGLAYCYCASMDIVNSSQSHSIPKSRINTIRPVISFKKRAF